MDKQQLKTGAIIIGIALTFIVIYLIYTRGLGSIKSLLSGFFRWVLILAAIGMVVYGVWWLFQTKRVDLLATHREAIIEAAMLSQTPYKQTLAMQAHGDDWAVRNLGIIEGICMIQSAPKRDNTKTHAVTDTHFENMIFCAFRPYGFFNWLFRKHSVVGGVPQDFSTLSGDTVYLKGMTFAPEIYGIMFLSHHWEKRNLIDETITQNVYRYTLQENLKDMATIVQDAIDASPKHKKEQDKQNIQMIPVAANAVGVKQ